MKKKGASFSKTCKEISCIIELRKRAKHTEETINRIREKRIDFLKKKTGKTAWERRSRSEMSFLEMWFQENVIMKFSLQEKHQIITEYYSSGYFIDFAFIDKMVAVEIDGRCHFDKNLERIPRDHRKDAALEEAGWKIIRMNFHDIRYFSSEIVQNFLMFLETSNSKYSESIGLKRYSDFKKSKKLDVKISRESKKNEINIQRMNDILSSNIDFTKLGWVKKASEIIKISPQKTRCWFRKNMPHLLVGAFTRNFTGV